MTLREAIALFDMDGTICDYVKAMHEALEKLRAPGETFVDPFSLGDDGNNSRYKYLWDRMNLIKSEEEWWANLPIFPLGWEVMDVAKETGYYCEILTQAPKKNPASLAGKLKWIIKHEDKLGEDIDFTITRNKSRHYGRVLVDDYPGYFMPWLEHRPKGLVIMPDSKYNKDFKDERVIRYDGTNLNQVKEVILKAKVK
ncbi:hypothetical protein J4205_02595 [Candidatus Pacearchaeota archaeon]|nr:hypothetical protein [Candidatus Pacearchaeota archaeon]